MSIEIPEGYEPPVEAMAALRQLEEGHPLVYLAGKAGCGKCVGGTTLVASPLGLKKIADYWPRGVSKEPQSWQEIPPEQVVTDRGLDIATAIYYGGLQPTRRITLSNGIQLECTSEHLLRCLTQEGFYVWKSVGELLVNDIICLAKPKESITGLENNNNNHTPMSRYNPRNMRKDIRFPAELSTELALFMGLVIGDGCWDRKYIKFTLADQEVELFKSFEKLARNLFGIKCLPFKSTAQPHQSIYSVGSVELVDWLEQQDFSHDPLGKYVPKTILESGPEIWKAFLSGILATDGHITKKGRFDLIMKPERLMREIQQMFGALGVTSTLSTKFVKTTVGNQGGTYWRLNLAGDGQNSLTEIFKYCPLTRKVAPLRNNHGLSNHRNISRFGDYSPLISRFTNIFKKCSASSGWNVFKNKGLRPRTFNDYYEKVRSYHAKYHASKFAGTAPVRLLSSNDFAELDELTWLFNEITPLKISSIEDSSTEVYDLCIPESHTFVANGIISHNSTFIEYLRQRKKIGDNPLIRGMVVVAPTGIAAINVGAQTIHSFLKIAPHDKPGGRWSRSFPDAKMKKLSLLVIDEISMVRADLMDLIDEKLRYYMDDDSPFGGIPILCVGDIFQLCPVLKQDEMREFYDTYAATWFFYANIFNTIHMICQELTKVYRQTDPVFIEVLNNIRLSRNLEQALQVLNAATQRIPTHYPMSLTATNDAADIINNTHLANIDEPAITFKAKVGVPEGDLKNYQSPPELTLKVGTRVMATANLKSGVVNGHLGWVHSIGPGGSVLVNFDFGKIIDITPHTWKKVVWELDDKKKIFEEASKGTYTQIPLRLGYAVSIHKAQGLTLDSVSINLGRRAFAPGQTYVALSRCRTLEGIHLTRPVSSQDLIVDLAVNMFYDTHLAPNPNRVIPDPPQKQIKTAQPFTFTPRAPSAVPSEIVPWADVSDLETIFPSKPPVVSASKNDFEAFLETNPEVAHLFKNFKKKIEKKKKALR